MDSTVGTCSPSGAAWLRQFQLESRRHAGVYAFIAAYAAVGFALALATGHLHEFGPLTYLEVLHVWMAVVLLPALWSLTTGRPFASLCAAARRAREPAIVARLVLLLALAVHLGVFTSVKTLLPNVAAFSHDLWLADLDAWLHGQDAWRWAWSLLGPTGLYWMEGLYYGAWGLLLPLLPMVVVLRERLEPVRAQFLWTHLLAWPLLGNVAAGFFASGGPILYQAFTGGNRFAVLTSELAPSGSWLGRELLWWAHQHGILIPGGGISAFPSMHMAQATLLVLLARRAAPALVPLALAFWAAILFGSVYLGWHYAIDGYASTLAVLAIWKAVGLALRRGAAPRAAPARLRLPA